MAMSVPAAAIRPLNSQHRSFQSPSTSLSRFSSSEHFSRSLSSSFGIGNRNSISSSRAKVQAKKQTFSSLDELLAGTDKPVIVDFYATWCGPCQFMVPILDKVSAALKDKIQVVKIDTEKYPAIAGKYKIEALPTFIIFKDGKPSDRFIMIFTSCLLFDGVTCQEGALTADQMIQRIEESLKWEEKYLREMEMETRAKEEIGMNQDITPPLPPLSFALHDFLLPSRCSACFSAVSSAAATIATSPFVVYCSAECASADSSLHFSSAEHHLFLLLPPSSWLHGDSSDLRASLRLIRRLELLNLLTPLPHLPGRIAGLMTNRDRLTSSVEQSVDEDNLARIKDGARAMAMARAMRDGQEFDGNCELEEAMICIVLTNAVEVQIGREKALGIAVYDGRFSWINHSCSPNACYRFNLCSGDFESSNRTSLRIGPANQIDDDDICELAEVSDTVSVQMLRQSDLWCKYQFLCNCIRCNGALSYVDHSLQEILPVDQHLTMISPERRGRFAEEMRDYFDTVISEYMSSGNAKSCCEKIENLLIGVGLLNGNPYLEKPSVMDFRLSPIHHLSLSAYTALSSAYRIQSCLVENTSKSLYLSRISTAYSLLLAGATHHLFISEPSLIASAANFWTIAGDSLVCFAQSLLWSSPVNQSFLASLVCENCLLMNKFKANFSCSVAEHEDLNKVSQQFLNCMTSITPKVWKILVQDCYYLAQIEDPINFSWLELLKTSNVWRFPTQSIHAENITLIDDGLINDLRMNTGLLGVHCLLYGSYLSGVCYGQDSSAANYANKMLQG
ncbi:hypothetical protein V2J09_007661 [Rumex salicifolius]